MASAVFSRHASLSEQLRTASSNLQQSLDALGSMTQWEGGAALSPGRYPATNSPGNGVNSGGGTPSKGKGEEPGSLLIQRIQELEASQQRQLKEQGDLRMALLEKDEKMRKMVAAHKRLKTKTETERDSSVQQRHVQSMEARKRAAEAAAKKAIAEKKDLQREVQTLNERLQALTSIAADGDGRDTETAQGGSALQREIAARIRAEQELAAARNAAAGGMLSPGTSAVKRERDALRHQLESLKAEMAQRTAGHRFTEENRTPKKASGSLLSQRTREEMEVEKARLQAEVETLSSAKLEVERQREVEAIARTDAENRATEAEVHAAELHQALRTLERHCADLEGSETTMKEQQRMVAELRSSVQAALVGEQEEEVNSVRQNEGKKREQAEKTLDQTVDDVVAQAEARFEGTLTDIDHEWSGHVQGTEAAITAAKQAIRAEYVDRISELTTALDQARSQSRQLQQTAEEHAQQLDNAEKRLTQERLISEQKLRDAQAVVRADIETSAEQQIQAAKAEAEAGWSDLVDILQTQAQEAQQEMLSLRRKTADTQQALIQAETASSGLREQVAKLHRDLLAAENRHPAEDQHAELERQELVKQLAASEDRATKLEQHSKELVKQARLDAEQKTLEDVEEIIQNLEDRNATLEGQLLKARAESGTASSVDVAYLEQRVAQLSADLSTAQDSIQSSIVQAAGAAEKLATETARRVQLQAEVEQLQLELRAASVDAPAGAPAADVRVAELTQQVADAAEKLAAERAHRVELQSEVEQLQLELQFAETTAAEPGDTSAADSRVAELTQQLAAAKSVATASAQSELSGLQTELVVEQELRAQAELEVEQLKRTVAELEEKAQRAFEEAVPPEGQLERPPVQPLELTTNNSAVSFQQIKLDAPDAENQVSMHKENLRALYAVADVNGDGNVSRAELVEALRRDPSLQSLFNLPIGKRLGPEERARIEAIFDDMDDDHSFGISFEEFAAYVQQTYSKLPVLPPGSYATGPRVVSIATDGSLSVTDPSELNEQRKILFHDVVPPTPLSARGRNKSTVETEQESIARSPRRVSRRGGVFTYHTGDSADDATKEIAALVGVEQIGMDHIVCDAFFGRRHRFRTAMKHKVQQELKLNKRKTHSMDLPGFWTRPTLSEPYAALLEPFTLKVHLPLGAVVELDCEPQQQMLELLDMLVSECEDVEEDSVPEEGAIGFVLKARGIFNYLDGDDKLVNYTHIRDQLKKGLTPEVVAVPRETAHAECMEFVAPELTEESFIESDSEDDEEDYETMERKFDRRAVRTSWPFIPISELRSSFRVTLGGVDNLEFEDNLPDPWIDPFRAQMAAKAQQKTPTKAQQKRKAEEDAAAAAKKVDMLPRTSREPSGANMKKRRSSLHGNEKEDKDEKDAGDDMVYVEAGLYYGGEQICDMVRTHRQPRSSNPHFNEVLDFEFPLHKLPRSTRICFTIWKVGAEQHENDASPLGWVGMYLFDDLNRLRQGTEHFSCWPMDRGNPIGTCEENMGGDPQRTPALTVTLDRYPKTVLYPRNLHLTGMPRPVTEHGYADQPWTSSERDRVKELLLSDPLEQLSRKDKKLMWKLRYMCTTRPEGLAKVLRAADWTDKEAVQEVHRLLDEWETLTPKQALELLDAHYPDERVRSYAVDCLRPLPDDELAEFVLQLVQVLKYEQSHDSTLATFLISRAIRCPNLVGHIFFWHLKAEMHVAEISERYGLILELYLELSPAHRKDLHTQNVVMELLLYAARSIKDKSVAKKDRKAKLHEVLAATEFPERFGLPLNPEWVCKGLKVEKCKYMDSKKLPLWLCFVSADPVGKDLYVMFKDGDDLRQDLLTLQMFRIMDSIWRREGLDLKMIPYGCVATGDEIGMLEIVTSSNTIANITFDMGGKNARSVYDKKVLLKWLEQHNPGDVSKMDEVIERFSASCAGYCVGTYALGIGDRHNDNVMLKENGNFFHIDFGHFLGNYKSKFGIKREKAPFIFTPAMAHVFGGVETAEYSQFASQCCEVRAWLTRFLPSSPHA